MVVVRSVVFVDPTDAHLRVVCDPIPRVLDGVPLRMRQIALDISRPGFMTSPTSCVPRQAVADRCGALRSSVEIDGQNGKSANQRPKLKASCGKKK